MFVIKCSEEGSAYRPLNRLYLSICEKKGWKRYAHSRCLWSSNRVLLSATRGLQRYANRNFSDWMIWFCDWLPIEVYNNILIGVVCDLPIVFFDLLIEVNNNMLIVDICDLQIGFFDL